MNAMRLLFLLLLFYISLFAEEVPELEAPCHLYSGEESADSSPSFQAEQIAPLTEDHSHLIGGIVSPLNGALCLREQDMRVQGAQEILVNRVYIAPYTPHFFHKHLDKEVYHRASYLTKHYEGWKIFPHTHLWTKGSEIDLTHPNGARYRFTGEHNRYILSNYYGVTNLNGDETPGGEYDPRNTRILCEGSTITVDLPDGSRRMYAQFSNRPRKLSNLYLLQKENLPSGKILRYHYHQDRLTSIESYDPKERFLYATLHVEGSPAQGRQCLISSTGQRSDYIYDSKFYKGHFRESGYKKKSYKILTPATLIEASTPNFRHEKISYQSMYHMLEHFSGKDKLFSVGSLHFGAEFRRHFRIDHIYIPSGENGSIVERYEIDYDPAIAGEKGGKTIAKNHDGSRIEYYFSKELIITAVHYFGVDGSLQKEKIYTWDCGQRLSSFEVRNEERELLYKKSYEYDAFSNPIVEKYIGDLRGEGKIESYLIKRTFSQDGRSLLLREENEERPLS